MLCCHLRIRMMDAMDLGRARLSQRDVAHVPITHNCLMRNRMLAHQARPGKRKVISIPHARPVMMIMMKRLRGHHLSLGSPGALGRGFGLLPQRCEEGRGHLGRVHEEEDALAHQDGTVAGGSRVRTHGYLKEQGMEVK